MLLTLFIGFLKIGLVGYGGGPASIPLVQKEFVENKQYITEDELIELVGICNMLPGPLITKVAAVVGYRKKGKIGALVSVMGMILPSTIALILILTFFYNSIATNKSVSNMVGAVMPAVTIMTLLLVLNFTAKARGVFKDKELFIYILLFIGLIYFLNINVIYVIIGVILLSLFLPKRKEDE